MFLPLCQVALHAGRSRMPAHQESQEFLVYTSSTTLPTFVFPDNFPANHAGVLRSRWQNRGVLRLRQGVFLSRGQNGGVPES
jgi:hypothetical protein